MHPSIAAELREAIEDYVAFLGQRGAQEEEARPIEDRSGAVLGDFRVVREIGRGGMGVVYEAEQLSLRRRVALKVLSAHVTLAREEVERFRREASTAARLRHPSIVEIHAVGETDGAHYFAMELVDGISLESWEPPSIEMACRVAEQVAEALDFAHRAGVIHRDVKPSNVLLRADGRALLTDFGLAREEGLASLTRTGRFVGTPHYVPPEQAASGGAPADHRSDVYSLGVTLYEWLTGRRPFEGATAHEILGKILVTEPPRPSRIDPRISADLATIVLKAMEKDPALRYSSAAALAADLRALREGRPIAARPAGPWARNVRWARRNPAWATASALALLLVVGGPLVLAIREASARKRIEAAYGVAKDEAERARADFDLARAAVDRMLTRVSQIRLRFEPRMEGLRREILESALELYREFVARHAASGALREDLARSHQHLAEIREMLGDTAGAIASWDEAARGFDELAREEPASIRLRQERSLCWRGRGHALASVGRLAEAEADARASVDDARSLVAAHPGTRALTRDLAIALCVLGALELQSGHKRASEEAYAEGVALYREIAMGDPSLRSQLARYLDEHARVLLALGREADAESALREALSNHGNETPNDRDWRGGTLTTLGALVVRREGPASALPIHEDCVSLRRGLVDEFPSFVRFRAELAASLSNLAATLGVAGDARSEEICREARDQYERLVADLPESSDAWHGLAGSLNNLGLVALSRRETADALALFDRALASERRAITINPKNPAYRAFHRIQSENRARCLLALGRFEEAETAAEDLAAYFDDSWEEPLASARILGRVLAAMEPRSRESAHDRLVERAMALLRIAAERGLPRAALDKADLTFLRASSAYLEIADSLGKPP